MIELIDPEKCNGCGICEEICPMDVLRMDPARRRAMIVYQQDCQTCFQCELECPSGAILVNPLRKNLPGLFP